MRNRWSLFMLIILAIIVLLAFAMPARAQDNGAVFGLPIEITGTARAHGDVWHVSVRGRGQTDVRDSSHCGAPPIGPAYAQYVRLQDGTEYRTLYAGCAYEILP